MINIAEIFKGCIAALNADGTFNALIAGRVYPKVKRSPTFPFVRINTVTTFTSGGFLNASHPKWIWGQTFDFLVYSLSKSPLEVGTVLDALGDVIEDKTKITVTGAELARSAPGAMRLFQDEDTETWTGVLPFDFLLVEA